MQAIATQAADIAALNRPATRCRSRRVGLCRLPDHPPQRRGGRVRAEQDRRRADEGLPGGARHAGRGLGQRARDGRHADRGGGARAAALAPGRRHLPHRRRAGQRRTRPDARRPPRGGARLRAVPRAAHAGARAPGRGAGGAAPPRSTSSTTASACRSTWRRCSRWSSRPAPAWAPTSRPSRSWPRRAATCTTACRSTRSTRPSILAARTLIEKDPAYSRATARLLLHTIRREILGGEVTQAQMGERYAEYFPQFIKKGVQAELLDEKLLQFDLARLGAALLPERDLQFDYLGLQTLYDRYFLHIDEQRIEMPQAFFMRVAMGLALNEIDREARAIEFYDVLSSFDFMSSTPTLFNAGTRRSQLSSCYLTTVADDLDGIYEALKENALLSQVRRRPGQRLDQRARAGLLHQGHQRQEPGRGAVPEGGQRHRGGGQPGRQAQGRGLRLPGDLAPGHRGVPRAAQEHRRRPPAHARHEHRQLDPRPVHEAGDGRRRLDAVLAPAPAPTCTTSSARTSRRPTPPTRPRSTAARSSSTSACRPRTCGARCCRCCSRPGIRGSPSRTPATCARPQQHVGVVHRSNLCTEITLNTSDTEIAVCNLGSVNLAQHLKDAPDGQAARPGQAEEDRRHGDAHARQRHRHQLLRGEEGARQQPAPPPGRPGHHGFPGQPVPAARALRQRRGGGVRRPLDGSRVLPRLLGLAPNWPPSAAATRSYRGSLWDRGVLPLDSLDLLAEAARRLRRGRPLA